MKKKEPTRRPLPAGTEVRRGIETEDGVALLDWRVEIPAFDAAPNPSAAASYYSELLSRTAAFLSTRLTADLREAYRRADPARRRFVFRRAVYRHTVRTALSPDRFSVERTVELTRAGRVLFSSRFREDWSPDGTELLPGTNAPEKKRAGQKDPGKIRKTD